MANPPHLPGCWSSRNGGGFFLGAYVADQRVAVFVDYQNVYKRAREAFNRAATEYHVGGQIRPAGLGWSLCSAGQELTAVHMYRGMPSPRYDPKGHAASQRQVSAWGHKTLSCMSRAGLSTTGTRQTPRRRASMYISPSTSLPRRCPVSSTSALFVPTTRTFIRRWRLSVISQQTESGSSYVDGRDAVRSPRIVIAGGRTVPTRLLDFSEYTQIRDTTDYTQPARRKPRPPKPPGH